MAALLEWDANGERNIESGVSKVVLFPYIDSVSGTNHYNNGVAWNGVTGITENPSGADITDLFADNQKYASLRGAENFGCTIEAFTYPDEWNQCDGSAVKAGIPGVYFGQQTRKSFCLAYRTEIGDDQHPGMDKGYRIHLLYNLTASPSSRGYTTINDNPDAITFSWEANANGQPCTGLDKNVCCLVIDSTKCNTTPSSGTATPLEQLETAIYGVAATSGGSPTPAVPAYMPTPDQVVTMMGGSRSVNNTRSLDDDDR